jgi:hypothetical protein
MVSSDATPDPRGIRVMYPFQQDAHHDDRRWLRELTEAHGGVFPEVELASLPGQVDLWFPSPESATRFRAELDRAGRFRIVTERPAGPIGSASQPPDDVDVGARRAVAVYEFGVALLAEVEAPDPPADLSENGPWDLEEWDGDEWIKVGHATRRRTRNRFLSGHNKWQPPAVE